MNQQTIIIQEEETKFFRKGEKIELELLDRFEQNDDKRYVYNTFCLLKMGKYFAISYSNVFGLGYSVGVQMNGQFVPLQKRNIFVYQKEAMARSDFERLRTNKIDTWGLYLRRCDNRTKSAEIV